MTSEDKTDDLSIGATESRLLQAMSIDDGNAAQLTEPLQNFTAYAGVDLAANTPKASKEDMIWV